MMLEVPSAFFHRVFSVGDRIFPVLAANRDIAFNLAHDCAFNFSRFAHFASDQSDYGYESSRANSFHLSFSLRTTTSLKLLEAPGVYFDWRFSARNGLHGNLKYFPADVTVQILLKCDIGLNICPF